MTTFQTMRQLADLKAGDEVAVVSRKYRRDMDGEVSDRFSYVRVHTIDRVTPTQIVVGKQRFRRDNGKQVGYYAGSQAEPVTDEHREWLAWDKSVREDGQREAAEKKAREDADPRTPYLNRLSHADRRPV